MTAGGLSELRDNQDLTYSGATSGDFDIDRQIIRGHLIFKDVTFGHKFTAKDLEVGGSVRFENCTFSEFPDSVNLDGLRCGGNLSIEGLKCAREIRLNGCRIGGSIKGGPVEESGSTQVLECRGFHCSDARITGSVFIEGIRCTDNGVGFPGSVRFVRSTIGGSLILTYRLKHASVPKWEGYRPILTGRLDLESCVIESNLIARGLKCDEIILILTRIGGTCSFRAWHPGERNDPNTAYDPPLGENAYRGDHAVRTQISKSIKGRHVSIRGSLNLSGASIIGEVDLRNSDIGAVSCNAWRKKYMASTRNLEPPPAVTLTEVGINNFYCVSDKDLQRTHIGTLVLSDSTVSGDVDLFGTYVARGFRASNCEIKGSLTIKSVSAIEGRCVLYLVPQIGANSDSPYDNSAIRLEESIVHGNLSINGARIQGVNLGRTKVLGSFYITPYVIGKGVRSIKSNIGESGRDQFRFSLKVTDIEISGLTDWSSTHFSSAIIGDGAEFGNDLILRHTFVGKGKYMYTVSGAVDTGLHLTLATVDGDLLIEDFRSDSSINITGTKVRGSLVCQSLNLKPGYSLKGEKYSLHARTLTVDGFTTLSGTCYSGAVLSGSILNNNVDIDLNISTSGASGSSICGFRMRNVKAGGKALLKGNINCGLSFEGTEVIGSARIVPAVPTEGHHAHGTAYGIAMAGAKIFGETHINSDLVVDCKKPVDLTDVQFHAGLHITDLEQRTPKTDKKWLTWILFSTSVVFCTLSILSLISLPEACLPYTAFTLFGCLIISWLSYNLMMALLRNDCSKPSVICSNASISSINCQLSNSNSCSWRLPESASLFRGSHFRSCLVILLSLSVVLDLGMTGLLANNMAFVLVYVFAIFVYFYWKLTLDKRRIVDDQISSKNIEAFLDYVIHNPQFYYELESQQTRLGNENIARTISLRSNREEMFKRRNWSIHNFARWILHNFTGHGARISPLVAIFLVLVFWATLHFSSARSVTLTREALASESLELLAPRSNSSIKESHVWNQANGFAIVMRHAIPFASFTDQNDFEPSGKSIGTVMGKRRMTYAQLANLLTISGWILIPVFISSGLRNLRMLDRRRFTGN